MPPKGSKAAGNPAPWWWEPAVCELWADGGKDSRQTKFYNEAVGLLDAAYGGEGAAQASKRSFWDSPGACS